MRTKGKPESKIPTTKTNTNRKRSPKVQAGEKKIDTALLKKNEFALIIFGALILTVIIFFLFFRSSGPKPGPVNKIALGTSTSIAELDKRIKKIEQALQLRGKQGQSPLNKTVKNVSGADRLEERVTRLETAFLVKFDSLSERMGKIENSISQLKNMPATAVRPKPVAKPAASVKKAVKKAVKKEKKTPLFHTVQKGETLYSISKKYHTSVAALRKLNNLSAKAKIYPGNNILVR